jgi:hypothetical protein
MRLFHTAEDCNSLEQVVGEGLARYPVDLLTHCLMPNHWRMVLRPPATMQRGSIDGLGWVGVTHVRPHQEHDAAVRGISTSGDQRRPRAG